MSTEVIAQDGKITALLDGLRSMTGQSILLSAAVAQAAGLNSTDLEALGVIQARKRTTAGDLALATGLTTGAVTSVMDRLERAGFVRRQRDPQDRRKVLVQVQPERAAVVTGLYGFLEAEMKLFVATYSDDQMNLLIDFMRNSTRLAAKQMAALSGKNGQ